MALEVFSEEGAKSLGARFLLTNLVPSAFLVLLIYLILSSGAPRHYPSTVTIIKSADALDGGRIVILLLAVLAISVIIQPFQVAMTKILEGYWNVNRLGRRLFDVGQELQRRKMTALEFMTEVGASSTDRRRQDWAISQLRSYPR